MTTEPQAVADLEREAELFRTPCGEGHLVWRKWGAGEPVVLCHGGSGSWTHWIKTIPSLAGRYEVWTPDLPGLGDSAMPPRPWTPTSSASVLAQGLRQLIPAERRAHLVGFSFGAHVATLAQPSWVTGWQISRSSAAPPLGCRGEVSTSQRSARACPQRSAGACIAGRSRF